MSRRVLGSQPTLIERLIKDEFGLDVYNTA